MMTRESGSVLNRRSFAAVGAAAVLAASHPVRESAAQETSAFVGTWRVDSRMGEMSRPVRWVIASDGTASGTVPATMPGFPGMAPLLYVSGVSGVWAADAPNTGAMTYDMQVSDETGMVLGYFTIQGTFEVSADGQTLTGLYTTTFTDPTGATMPLGGGDLSGTRMAVEPLVTPPASPEATPES
jgi:hypothetical protein